MYATAISACRAAASQERGVLATDVGARKAGEENSAIKVRTFQKRNSHYFFTFIYIKILYINLNIIT